MCVCAALATTTWPEMRACCVICCSWLVLLTQRHKSAACSWAYVPVVELKLASVTSGGSCLRRFCLRARSMPPPTIFNQLQPCVLTPLPATIITRPPHCLQAAAALPTRALNSLLDTAASRGTATVNAALRAAAASAPPATRQHLVAVLNARSRMPEALALSRALLLGGSRHMRLTLARNCVSCSRVVARLWRRQH